MQRLYLIIIISICTGIVKAQPIKTILKWDTTGIKSFKVYGEMFIKGTSIKEIPTLIIGGRGGYILNRKIAFGGVAAAYLNQKTINGNDLAGNQNVDLNVKIQGAGVFAEYINKMDRPIHVSFPLSFTIGKIEIEDSNFGKPIESSRVLMIEPGINIEFNFSKILIIAVTGSYRMCKIQSLINVNNQDLSGLTLGLVGKFSNF